MHQAREFQRGVAAGKRQAGEPTRREVISAGVAALLVPSIAGAEPAPDKLDKQPGLLKREFIYQKASFPSCHASTIEVVGNSLIAAWFGGSDEGEPDVGIWTARNDGKGWSAPVEVANGVLSPTTRYPCWNPVLQMMGNGLLVLFYKVGPKPETWWGMNIKSTDGGKTWSRPERLSKGVLGPIKNKGVLLKDGSYIAGSSTEHDGWKVHMERWGSKDQKWTKSDSLNDGRKLGAIQPAMLKWSEQKIQALCRTMQKRIGVTWSNDGGTTWSPLKLTTIPNPDSGIDATVLKDGRAMLVYNPVEKGRSPLVLGIVHNDPKTGNVIKVENVLTLENEPGEYSYPAIIQAPNGLLQITYTWKRKLIRHVVVDPKKLKTSGVSR
jgi:predicted neuraminidase